MQFKPKNPLRDKLIRGYEDCGAKYRHEPSRKTLGQLAQEEAARIAERRAIEAERQELNRREAERQAAERQAAQEKSSSDNRGFWAIMAAWWL